MASFGLAVLVMAGAALAGTPETTDSPVRIEIVGAPAFTAEELAKALMARLPPDAPNGTLHVLARPEGTVELTWQSRRRVVDLSEDKGPAAARVAALLAADLLLPLGLPLALPSVERQRPPTGLPSVVPTASSSLLLAADYELWSGPQGPLMQGVGLAMGVDRRHLRLRASAGWLSGQGSGMVDLTAWPLRLGAGAGLSFGALLANLVMVPYQLDGVVHVTRALAGLGLAAEVRIPLFASLAVQATAGFDVYLNRRAEVWAGPNRLFAMPSTAFRFDLGLSWGRSR